MHTYLPTYVHTHKHNQTYMHAYVLHTYLFDMSINLSVSFSHIVSTRATVQRVVCVEVKRVQKNLADPENAATCTGEALILDNRVDQSNAACLLLDVESGMNKPQDEVVGACLLLKEFWHCMSTSLKASLCEMNVVINMQSLHTCDTEEVDPESIVRSIVDAILPVSTMGLGATDFDAVKPTMHSIFGDIYNHIGNEFDLDEMELDEETAAKQLPYIKDLKARPCPKMGNVDGRAPAGEDGERYRKVEYSSSSNLCSCSIAVVV